MKLSDCLKEVSYELLCGNEFTDITDVIYDSRKAVFGTAFICITGAVSD